jgi:hypothetical protein
MIRVTRGNDASGQPSVAIVLSPNDVFLDENGTPTPGAALKPSQARSIAYLLLWNAEQLEAEIAAASEQS